MKRVFVLIFAIVSFLYVFAKNDKEANFEFSPNRAGISGMLTSSDSWQLEMSYHYMINKNIGIGGAAGAWKVYFVEGWAAGKNWHIDSDDEKPMNLYLRPSVVLRTPAISIKSVDLGIYAEPGLMMNVPYTKVWIQQTTNWPECEYKSVSTSKGQWFALDVHIGVYANIGPCGISAGYMRSNFDVYSQYRHLSYRGQSFKDFYPAKSIIQGAYLTLSCYF